MSKFMFKVWGMQRTGTNYLSELVEENFQVHSILKHGWKHAPVINLKETAHVPERIPFKKRFKNLDIKQLSKDVQNSILDENIGALIIIKNPYTWALNIERWWNASYHVNKTLPELFQMYNELYSSYRKFRLSQFPNLGFKKCLIVRYEDLLQDLDRELDVISGFFDIPVINRNDLSKVEYSAEFTPERREHYLNPISDLKVAELVDWDLMFFYGYTREKQTWSSTT